MARVVVTVTYDDRDIDGTVQAAALGDAPGLTPYRIVEAIRALTLLTRPPAPGTPPAPDPAEGAPDG